MGVSGSGKSTVGHQLANSLSIPFFDGDDYHPQINIDKMSQGIPLNDLDRRPWLENLHALASKHKENGCVIACSALKEKYRKILSHSIVNDVQFVFLKGEFELIHERMKNREGHFMEPAMLQSQFDTLEEPEEAIVVDISSSLETLLSQIKLNLK